LFLLIIVQAAGISSVIKSLLLFEHSLLTPSHKGIKTTLNATFTSALQKNIRVSRHEEDFETEQRRIIVNNFSATLSVIYHVLTCSENQPSLGRQYFHSSARASTNSRALSSRSIVAPYRGNQRAYIHPHDLKTSKLEWLNT